MKNPETKTTANSINIRIIQSLFILLTILFAFPANTLNAQIINNKTKKQIEKQKNIKIPAINPHNPKTLFKQCDIPDLAITNLRVGSVSADREQLGFYEVVINGDVVNAGKGIYPLGSKPVNIGREPFDPLLSVNPHRLYYGELAAGQRRSFYFRISQVSSSADFIPDYSVSINMTGPDCNSQNNRKIITGNEIAKAINEHLQSSMQITRVRACVRPGGSVIIDGHNFGSRSSRYVALFGTSPGEILSWTDRQLIIKAPTNLDPNMTIPLTLHASSTPTSDVMTYFNVRTCPSSGQNDRTSTALATPADFKFGTMINPGDQSLAKGERPLLVLLLQAPSGEEATPQFAHDKTYYERLVFGPGYPNVVDYFKVNSYFTQYTARGGRGFSWKKAAIIGPVSYSLRNSTLSERYTKVQSVAAANGFDFKRYDRNNDGRVTESELGILVFENFSNAGGQTLDYTSDVRVSIPGSRQSIRVSSGVSQFHQSDNFLSVAHELSHQLGTIDIYGTGCFSSGLSLMSCTGSTNRESSQKWSFLLDPWHRSRLGWLKPRIYQINTAGSVLLRAPSQLYGEAYNGGPIILYDPRKGTREYFILEYRNIQRLGTATYGYDAGIPRKGVAVWHVKTDAAGELIQIPDRIPESINHRCEKYTADSKAKGKNKTFNRQLSGIGLSCGNVSSAVAISPEGHGRLKSGWGGNALWNSSDGEFGLKWLNDTNSADGDDVGIRLRVYGEGKDYARIRWDPK